jgi:transcriptional regulator with XRE-family HTH domain
MDDPSETKAVIARNLRRLREKRGLSRRSLARLAEASPLALREIEAGRILPDIGLISRLAAVFEVSCIAFLEGGSSERKDAGLKPSRWAKKGPVAGPFARSTRVITPGK